MTSICPNTPCLPIFDGRQFVSRPWPLVTRCFRTWGLRASLPGSTSWLSDPTVAIDTPSCPVPGATARFTLPEIPERLSPLFAAIPLQFIGYYLACAFGASPDQSQDVSDPARFRAAQLLARRGELTAESR